MSSDTSEVAPITDLFLVARIRTSYRTYQHQRIKDGFASMRVHEVFMGDSYVLVPGEVATNETAAPRPTLEATQSKWSKYLAHWRSISRMKRDLGEAAEPAVVVSGYNDPSLMYLFLWCHLHGIPVFLSGDSNLAAEANKRKLLLLGKRSYLFLVRLWVSGVLPVGSRGRDYFLHYGFDPSKIFLVPLEVDVEFFRESVPRSELVSFRRRHNLGSGRSFFIYSGRLVQVKGVETVVAAFVNVASQLADWDLLIAGSGPLETEIRALVPTELLHRVHWLGWCTQAELRLAYELSTALVLPSWSEPWGLAVNEAVAAGLVAITSDVVGAAADLVDTGPSGSTFRVGDTRRLAELLTAVSVPSVAEELAEASSALYTSFRKDFDAIEGLKAALDSLKTSL